MARGRARRRAPTVAAMRPHLIALILAAAPERIAAGDAAARGAVVYALHCLRCHGPTATEGQSGDIRGLDIDTITGAVRSGPGMMPLVPLSDAEIADLRAYLLALNSV